MVEFEAYVISIVVQKEADAIVTFLTNHGIQKAYVHGMMRIKSKYSILGNRFIKVKLSANVKNNYLRIKEVKLMSYPSSEVLNIKINEQLSNLVKVMMQVDSINEAGLFLIFDAMLQNISDINKYTIFIYAHITKLLGIEFSMNCCAKCQSTNNIIAFDLYEGGYLCANCTSKQEVMTLSDLSAINELFNYQVSKYLKREENVEFKLKLVDFLSQVMGLKIK